MGLILKCNEMSEKMKHYNLEVRGGVGQNNQITHAKILNQVVENTETFRILAILNINKGTNFGSLKERWDWFLISEK